MTEAAFITNFVSEMGKETISLILIQNAFNVL